MAAWSRGCKPRIACLKRFYAPSDIGPVLDFQKKILGPAGRQVFIFCRQNKYSGRQKLYLSINGFSFVKDNGLSLVYVFPKKKVTYLGGQVGDQA